MICPSCNDGREWDEGVIHRGVTFMDPSTFIAWAGWHCMKCEWKTRVGYTAEELEDKTYSLHHVQIALWHAYNNGNPTQGVMLHDTINVLDRLSDIL